MRWDLDWEKVFKILKDPMKVYRLLLQGRPMLGEMDKEAIDTYCAALREAQKTAFVCARCFRAPEFKLDKLWQLWDDDKRLQHMFAGLEFACESSPLSQDARVLCPEVSISHLLRDRGEAFVDLVRKFITSAGQTPPYALPFPFPDPWWQQLAREFPKPQPEAYIAMTLIRQEFIANFITGVYVSVEDVYDKCNSDAIMDAIKDVRRCYLDYALEDLRDRGGHHRLPRCKNCHRSAAGLEARTKLLECRPCKENMNVSVYYCSKGCQREDWPLHKGDCGRTSLCISDLPAIGSEVDEFPLPGAFYDDRDRFLQDRSAAFKRLVLYLDQSPDADYVLFTSDDKPVDVIIDDSKVKYRFRLWRARVLHGVPFSVPMPAEHLIKHYATKPGLSRSLILEQLEKEHGVTPRELDIICTMEETVKESTRSHLEELEAVLDNLQELKEICST